VRLIVSLLALALASPVLAQDAEKEIQALYKAKKWAQALERADAGPATPETEFWAARALRNLKRSEAARERYLKLAAAHPGHERASDASIEAALMLVVDLDQVAHDKAERKLAVQAARELETVAATRGLEASKVARAAYIAGNTWRIAERDKLAEEAYLRAQATGDAGYAAKALDKRAELAYRGLEPQRAEALWRECIEKHGKTSSGRASQRALTRLAVTGKPAPDFEVELWAQGEAVGRDDMSGRVTLVFAFAVWCPHCKRELPHAADLIDDYSKRGFQVVALTRNGSKQSTADVFPFVADEQYRMDYPVAIDLETRTTDAWSLTGLPSAALVDREGIVRWVGHPNFLSRASIETLLDEKPAKKS
jgi:peroxiredoxin